MFRWPRRRATDSFTVMGSPTCAGKPLKSICGLMVNVKPGSITISLSWPADPGPTLGRSAPSPLVWTNTPLPFAPAPRQVSQTRPATRQWFYQASPTARFRRNIRPLCSSPPGKHRHSYFRPRSSDCSAPVTLDARRFPGSERHHLVSR